MMAAELRKRAEGINSKTEFYLSDKSEAQTCKAAAEEIEKLAGFLKKAIGAMGEERRTDRRCTDFDPAGSTYEVTLKPWVREALELIGENPDLYE